MSDYTGVDGESPVDRVCHNEQMTIWTGEIVDSLSMGGYFRERLSYDDGLHIHSVIARDLRSIIGSAFLQAEAPDQISDLKAENERLRIIIQDREWKRDLAEHEVDQLSAALAESERKRVEAETSFADLARATGLLPKQEPARVVWLNEFEDATPTQETPHVES